MRQGEGVFSIAQDGPRDAVFNVYEGLLAKPPASDQITVSLIADPSIATTATIRKVSPLVDSSNRAVKVKATLTGTPPQMALGAPVLGRGKLNPTEGVVLPWSALFSWHGDPAVWVVDAGSNTVQPKRVTIEDYTDSQITLKNGVSAGDRVVTAGIQVLRPGQTVSVVKPAP